MSAPKIAYEDVVRVARELSGERKNPPIEKNGCLNTGADGRHCLVSEILVRLGASVPKYGDPANGGAVAILECMGLFHCSDTTLSLLSNLQTAADVASACGHDDAWGLAIDYVLGAE